jgi:hypothetical protein
MKKAKPVARQGRKATGLWIKKIAGLPPCNNGGNVMKKLLVVLFAVALMFGGADAYALGFGGHEVGENITLFDKMGDPGEDNETEPGTINKQSWDLEAFFLNGSILSVVGGFDFVNGVGSGSAPDTDKGDDSGDGDWHFGDIFIDLAGYSAYDPGNSPDMLGNGQGSISNVNFGYDFVIDFDRDADGNLIVDSNGMGSYAVHKLDADSVLQSVYYKQLQGSNPYAYLSGASDENYASGNFQVFTDLGDDLGLTGGKHNLLTGIELDFLTSTNNVLFHVTEQCGNDTLVGDPVPEPGTLLLLGFGLIGVFGLGRKHMHKE